MGAVTLLTDLSTSDGYAGTMHGVILRINPAATVVDISHDIPPQDVAAAAFVLSTVYPYFDPSTVHVVIVDPGVGSERRALAVRTPRGIFVAPDNGVLSYVFAREACHEIVHLTERRFWLSCLSDTFHGRDLFAPVAAHLSLGVPIGELGSTVNDPLTFEVPTALQRADGSVDGKVVYVDHFGNLITNVPRQLLPGAEIMVLVAGREVKGLRSAYAAAADGELLALVGSHGYLEIAERNGSAAALLRLKRGARIRVSSG